MSVVKLNPVDGLPEFTKVRKVVTERQRARAAKRARRFIMVEWGELVRLLRVLGAGRAVRLLFALWLHQGLNKTRRNDDWIEVDQKDLIALDLSDSNLSKATYQLETLGLVEVQRRPGKRPLLRLIKP